MLKIKAVKTRSDTNVWLIGQQLLVLDELSCSGCLPTVGLVLRRLFYDLKTNKLSLSQGCSNTVDEVLHMWFIANIPTTQKRNAVAKLKTLYDNYVGVGKNKSQRTEKQMELETDFGNGLNKLFDIAQADCEKLIKIQQDKIFLQDQREERKMTIGKEDLEFKEREEKRLHRQLKEMHRMEKAMKATDITKSATIEQLSSRQFLKTKILQMKSCKLANITRTTHSKTNIPFR